MPIPTLHEQVQLFKSVFKGRDDVFAIRWEKPAHPTGGENKSGYMPAYSFDPYFYRAHKAKGGTFQNYKDKAYLGFTQKVDNSLFSKKMEIKNASTLHIKLSTKF